MRILLTGHRGYIGEYLFKRLSIKHDLVGIDLVDGDNLLTCNLPSDIDLVIHLAGKSGVRSSINRPAEYWFNNVEVSRRLFQRYKNIRILYASSSTVYEPHLNPYSASKYMVEEIGAGHTDALAMRFHTVYSDKPRSEMFMDLLLSGKLEYVTSHYRDFIHINDLMNAIEILIERPHIKGELDIGTGEPIKISELAPDLPIRLNTPGERNWTCANIDLLKTFGFLPKVSIKKFLTKYNETCIINNNNGEHI